ncbi:MAG: hypothetical protein OHK0013_06900 [Sandaracinaceae bacterium]
MCPGEDPAPRATFASFGDGSDELGERSRPNFDATAATLAGSSQTLRAEVSHRLLRERGARLL